MARIRLHAPATIEPQGSAAREISQLWWLMAALGLVVFVIVVVGLVIGLRRGSEERQETSAASRRWLIGGGVALPSIVIVGVFIATVFSMDALSHDGDADLTIEVTGHQWWWEVRYPDSGVVTANEVHIPAGRRVALRLRSADVIHSFWVPALAGKTDLLPERENTLVIDADRPGTYDGVCAEFCGIQHANMNMVVVAHAEADFDDWIAEQSAPAAEPDGVAARRGADLFRTSGCSGCHAVAGTDADGDEGPDLTHVASRTSIGAGVVDNSLPDLEAWIADPHAVKEGVLMPALDLDDEQIDDLVAYVSGLR